MKLIKTKMSLPKGTDYRKYQHPTIGDKIKLEDSNGKEYDFFITYTSGVIYDVDANPMIYLYGNVEEKFSPVEGRDK